VAGHCQDASGNRRVVFWVEVEQSWQMVVMPGLGGPDDRVEAINDAGDVVGNSELPDGEGRPVLWQKVAGQWTVTDLGTLGGPGGTARGINNLGDIVGGSDIPSLGYPHPVLWQFNGVGWDITDLPTPGGAGGTAYAITEDGLRIVGAARTTPGETTLHAALWQLDDGAWTYRDLGVISGDFSIAEDINQFGEVIGWSVAGNGRTEHAALWRLNAAGEVVELRDLHTVKKANGSRGRALSDVPQAVGALDSGGFLWDETDGMRELIKLLPKGSGWSEVGQGWGINNAGKIVGSGVIKATRETHAYLLTPNP
jgi:uncharacterized membrane protein